MTFALNYNMAQDSTDAQKEEILDFSATMKAEGKTNDIRWLPDYLVISPNPIPDEAIRFRTFIDQAAVNEWINYCGPRGAQNIIVYQQTT